MPKVSDLGPPASYLVIEPGHPVYSSDGEKVGEVEHVLADLQADIFDGIVLDTSILPGGHRFVDATQIDEIRERGIVVALTAEQARRLPKPSENPAAVETKPEDTVPDNLEDKLRRAWEKITGRA